RIVALIVGEDFLHFAGDFHRRVLWGWRKGAHRSWRVLAQKPGFFQSVRGEGFGVSRWTPISRAIAASFAAIAGGPRKTRLFSPRRMASWARSARSPQST